MCFELWRNNKIKNIGKMSSFFSFIFVMFKIISIKIRNRCDRIVIYYKWRILIWVHRAERAYQSPQKYFWGFTRKIYISMIFKNKIQMSRLDTSKNILTFFFSAVIISPEPKLYAGVFFFKAIRYEKKEQL